MFRTLILGAASVGLGLASAHARPLHPVEDERPIAANEAAVRPVAAVVTEGQPVCTHTRRRLWLESEGWVVRKISTCR
ncbi:hypothetical protein [Methylobacterium sp. J-076]|uniref:hypothetical protein n=1 Tax=Methylobacterium sp. J-076 TaxID=2836655 RepID=UPI001FB86DFB|nr:hypothetical protein [Methylobacterium sp. J-076]MCJ2015418.1 hypothetical protein [Methylobacterium sp. J-076]